jgi:uncharacterized membrane protein YgcG
LIDFNKDGKIEFDELAVALAVLLAASNVERDEFFFDVFDRNKDGELDLAEIMKIFAIDVNHSFTRVRKSPALIRRSLTGYLVFFYFQFFRALETEMIRSKKIEWSEIEAVTRSIVEEKQPERKALAQIANNFVRRLANMQGTPDMNRVSKKAWMELCQDVQVRSEIDAEVASLLSAASKLEASEEINKLMFAASHRTKHHGGRSGRSGGGSGGGSSYGGGGWDSD